MHQLSKKSVKDLEGVLGWTAQNFGIKKMIDYHASLADCFELLANNPKLGIKSDHIRNGYYCFYHQSHTIFYKIIGDNIFIVRILHKSMNVVDSLM